MSVEKFLAELERQNLLSTRQLAKLRETAPERGYSTKALAKFLVQKQLISQSQANDVLSRLAAGGADLDARSAAEKATTKQTAPAGQSESVLADIENEADSAGDGGSSIFAPYLTGRPTKKPKIAAAPTAEVGELRIVADDEPATAKLAASAPVTSIDQGSPTPTRLTTRLGRRDKKTTTSKKPKPTKRKKHWDSPLILMGGGGLALLVLAGATVWWLLNWESADQKLQLARSARDSGAYGQAIEHYRRFLDGSPRHPERSLARVELATVTIRQATEAAKFAEALELAQQELEAIEEEEDFDEVHGELAALLPKIALGLAQQAEQSGAGSEEASRLTTLANDALALCNNVIYIPKTFRDETKLTVVRETLQRVERHQATHRALGEAMSAMEQSIAANQIGEAYLRHKKLTEEYPEVDADAALGELLRKVIAAEQSAIRFTAEEQAAETQERPTPWVAALAIARRQGPAAAGGQNGATCVRVDGAVYGLNAATGRLLWRRHVGISTAPPIRLGEDVLVVDNAHQELLRLNIATGELRWRQTIGEPFAQPVVVGERGFVAADSGRLLVIDLQTGGRSGYMQFAQPLRATPTANVHHQRLYLAGDHSTLYSISLTDLTCAGVYFLGHSAGSIRVSPALVLDKLAILENDGTETSRLRLLSLDDQGTVASEEADRRLTGSATATPIVRGGRLLVLTDRGQIDVFDVGSGEEGEVLTLIASRAATGKEPVARHAAVVGQSIWVGDTQLTKYSVLPTGNRLPIESIENSFVGSTFDHPLELMGNALIHVRRPKGKTGAAVAAINTGPEKLLWETQLAIPPAGPPIVDRSAKAFIAANSQGDVFRIDETAMRSAVLDQPLSSPMVPARHPSLTSSVDLNKGRGAFCAIGFDQLLLYNPVQGQQALRWIKLPSPLACAVTPLGDGIIVPLEVGQVFYLGSGDGSNLLTPFQPRVEPRTTTNYQPAGVADEAGRRFVITDGREKIYLVAVVEQPTRHLQAVSEANVGPYPIQSPIVVLGETALAVAGETHVVRFKLPSLEPAGDTSLSAAVVWGPFRVGDAVLLATADNQLHLISEEGKQVWQVEIENGELTGAPLTANDAVLIAYGNGIIERRSLSDGKRLGLVDVEHSLAAGPVIFLQRIVVTATDGTLLVVNQP